MKSFAGAAGPVERFHVGLELNEVARDEPRGEAHVPQDVHQQPRRVAARAGPLRERLVARLHARLQADQVADRRRLSFWFSSTRKSIVFRGVRSIVRTYSASGESSITGDTCKNGIRSLSRSA